MYIRLLKEIRNPYGICRIIINRDLVLLFLCLQGQGIFKNGQAFQIVILYIHSSVSSKFFWQSEKYLQLNSES